MKKINKLIALLIVCMAMPALAGPGFKTRILM